MDIDLAKIKLTSARKDITIPVKYNPAQILKLVIEIGKKLMPVKYDKEGKLIEFTLEGPRMALAIQLVYYFFNDPAFEGNLSSGLWIHGRKGTGKTMLLRIFREMSFNGLIPTGKGYNLAYCSDIAQEYEAKGAGCLGKYHEPVIRIENNIDRVYATNWAFDDLGSENLKANHFQNVRNVMQEILDARYRRYIELGSLTFITTNLNQEIIESKDFYNVRIGDRFHEMFNDIKLDGPSLRPQAQ